MALLAASLAPRALAVILNGTGDPFANTTAPTGALEDSGWQWIGRFGSFCGTPIGPSSFLTAAHIGGAVGDTFEFEGRTFRTQSSVTDPVSDLRVWHVHGEFTNHAEIDRVEPAAGDGLVVFGRGGRRGAELRVNRDGVEQLSGWYWGPGDGRLRWGTNTVDELLDGATVGGFGPLLTATFDHGAGGDECQLSVGDSGGPVFVLRPGGWRLAGVNYATEPEFRMTVEGASFFAAVFDAGGLFHEEEKGKWALIPVEAEPQPSHWFATRVGTRAAWIDSVLATAPARPTLEASEGWVEEFQPVVPLRHDPFERYFEVEAFAGHRLFRLRGASGLRIRSIRVSGSVARIDYE